jgi:iodotyrosine deiodinase
MKSNKGFIPYPFQKRSETQILENSSNLLLEYSKRRSIRHFSDENVDQKIIENLIMIAASAPSGANKQPWTFCAVSNLEIKKKIREAAEKEEYINYHGRMSDEWMEDLAHLGTDWNKEFLEIAPWLIIVFKKSYDVDSLGEKQKNYYVSESVGIASGFLIGAIHEAGLVCLTHTPSPMDFLCRILNRPINEKPWLLIPVGYPSKGAMVPDISRKSAEDVISWFV